MAYTLSEVYDAIRKADAAGDGESVLRLAAYADKLKAPKQGPAPKRESSVTGDLLAGAVRGAGSIGATLMAPVDAAARALGVQNDFIGRTDRRQAMDQALSSLGADTDSLAFGAGKLGTEIAGTMGVGGALARGAAILPGAARAAPVLDAISSAGFKAGGLTGARGVGARMLGGGVTGGASAALVNPEDADSGAAIGALLPPALQAAGVAGRAVGGALRSPQKKGGAEIAKALDLGDPQAVRDAVAKLRAAQSLVPGSVPTAAQALQTPQAGVLQRVMADSKGGAALQEQLAAQNAARLAMLEGVAPTNPTGFASARQDMGEAIGRTAKVERASANEAVGGMYRAVDPAAASRIVLPADEMKAAADKYLGAGSVGENNWPKTFAEEAKKLSAPIAAPVDPVMIGSVSSAKQPRGSTWAEVLRMRSSLNEQWIKAKNGGDRQAAAALDAQKAALDSAIEKQLPPGMLNQWREANASRAALGQRFDNGPQGAIFKTRDGVPVLQGGEISSKFWGNRPGLADDVKSFRRLVDDNPRLLGQFRSMVTTEGASTATAGGNLSSKFVRWVDNTLPGLEATFDKGEVQALKRIAADIKRADSAAASGMARGSNTYQNAQNALSLGMLDSPLFQSLAVRAPMPLAAPIQWMRDNARTAKAERMSGLLADAGLTADALMAGAMAPPSLGLLGSPTAGGFLLRSAPLLGGDR